MIFGLMIFPSFVCLRYNEIRILPNVRISLLFLLECSNMISVKIWSFQHAHSRTLKFKSYRIKIAFPVPGLYMYVELRSSSSHKCFWTTLYPGIWLRNIGRLISCRRTIEAFYRNFSSILSSRLRILFDLWPHPLMLLHTMMWLSFD